MEALLQDPEATKEEKDVVNIIHRQVANQDDEVNLMLCKEIAHVASYCQVVQTPKKGFINITLFPTEDNDILMAAFDRIWKNIGKRQWDPPPPKPVNKDIRKWALDQKNEK